MKLKVGIVFGGYSREREISFAGGRTVYDNLNKSLFEPIPLFVDSFGNFILLNWEFIYKGSIRDFYPPIDSLPPSPHQFQIYAESLGNLTLEKQNKLIKKIGKRVELSELSSLIDFAFLCLHGAFGEDGRVQGLLESLHIPYSGSGILSSAIGMNKAVQKQLMINAGFDTPKYSVIKREEWLELGVRSQELGAVSEQVGKWAGEMEQPQTKQEIYEKIKAQIGFPLVVKPANQGSSIGASVVQKDELQNFIKAVNKAFFILELEKTSWEKLSEQERRN